MTLSVRAESGVARLPSLVPPLAGSKLSSGRIRKDNANPRIINTASHTKGSSQFWKRSIR